jgi:hypothetical protein
MDLEPFIQETLTVHGTMLQVEIVREEAAETFAVRVRKDMEKSNIIGKEDDNPF